jgi:hypothetical protein
MKYHHQMFEKNKTEDVALSLGQNSEPDQWEVVT